uniref:Intraflagellar transport protein 22 homolog n=1 Tax=Phallusia mammillata TaxID=59560 RepID=A0A6F9DEC1_9ASCI|nr:intraflagellar transport protein 22 homolog [Phallusia mammillata]
MYKAKICVVGPCEGGKTLLSNFLGDQTDIINSTYKPTAGVRILEFENLVESRNNNSVKVDVELWDCSGNENLESCWPAMAHRADGVIIVFDPAVTRTSPSVEAFYNFFVTNQKLKPGNCLLFANSRSKENRNIPSPLPNVQTITSNFENKSDEIQNAFQKLLEKILVKLSDSRDKEELSIIS